MKVYEGDGSAGEVKNDTERPQDRENNVLDAESEVRHVKNHKHSKQKVSKNMSLT